MDNVLYKFDSHNTSLGVDQFDDAIPGHNVVVTLEKYKVLKRTPQGAWIQLFGAKGNKRFALLTARKQFACNNIEEAKLSFLARKNKYIRILQSKIDDTNKAILILIRGKFSEW